MRTQKQHSDYKKCKKCGESKILSEFEKVKKNKSGIGSWCIVCCNRRILDWKKRTGYAGQKRYNAEHKDARRLIDLRYRAKKMSADHLLYKSGVKISAKKGRDTLRTGYIKDQLRHKGFTREQIAENPELISIQRTIVEMKRLCKTSNN